MIPPGCRRQVVSMTNSLQLSQLLGAQIRYRDFDGCSYSAASRIRASAAPDGQKKGGAAEELDEHGSSSLLPRYELETVENSNAQAPEKACGYSPNDSEAS